MTNRPYASSSQPGPQGRHLTDYLRILYKRRWTAVVAFLAVFVYGAMNTLKKTPVYMATTQLLLEKEARRATNLSTVLDEQSSYYDDDFYPTQLRILRSRDLAWRSIQALGLNKPAPEGTPKGQSTAPVSTQGGPPADTSLTGTLMAWASRLVGAPEKIEPPPADETTWQAQQISGFLAGLVIGQEKGTRVFNVSYTSPDPVRCSLAANAIADQYIKQSLDSRGQASKEMVDYLSQQLEDQRKKLAESDLALSRYKETHDAASLDDKQNTVSTKLADLSAQATRAQIERQEKEITYKSFLKAQTEGRDALEALPAIVGNVDIQALKAALRTLEQKREQDAAQHGPKYAAISGIAEQIKGAQAKLWSAEDKVVEALKNDFQTAQLREQSYKEQLTKQTQEAFALDRKGVEYAALQREAASNKALYDNLLGRAKEIGVSSEFKGSSIRILDRAEIPRSPIAPNHRADMMMAALQGLLLALGLVFGFEYLDSRIKTPDEIKEHLDMPFLGIVPSISTKGRPEGNPLLTHDVPSSFAEALRAIRTAVIFSSAEEGARTVVITSTAPGEGKTLVATNLAVALAQADQRTLIIDGDMRRPKVHGVFGRPQEPGLSNVLVGTAHLRDALRVTGVSNLYVVSAGHLPPNPAELLGSLRYVEVMEELRQQFDWILVDAPPIMAVTDAAIISHAATGVVFVVGSEMTGRRNALAAVDQLRQARAKFIGAVLNRVNLDRHSYYYAPYYRKDYVRVYERTR